MRLLMQHERRCGVQSCTTGVESSSAIFLYGNGAARTMTRSLLAFTAARHPHAVRLVVQNDIQQRTMDFDAAVVLDEAELSKFVHEVADAPARRGRTPLFKANVYSHCRSRGYN
jgi:hypothetical protein